MFLLPETVPLEMISIKLNMTICRRVTVLLLQIRYALQMILALRPR